MKRRLLLFSFWFVLLVFVPATPALAYIDPATTTYIIQIVTAIIITLGVSLSIFFYRFQMIVTNLRISFYALRQRLGRRKGKAASAHDLGAASLNSSMELLTEEEVLAAGIINYPIPVSDNHPALGVYSPHVSEATAGYSKEATEASGGSVATEGSSAKKTPLSPLRRIGRWLWEDKRGFKQRLPLSAVLAASLSMTGGVFSMLDTAITNETHTDFSVGEAFVPILVFGLVAFVILTAFIAVFRGRTFNFMVCVSFSLLVCSYLQCTFFNRGIGQLIGEPLGWEELGITSVIINSIIWIAVFAAIFILGLARRTALKQAFKRLVFFVPSLIFVVQVVALFAIFPLVEDWQAHQNSGTKLSLTDEDLFQVSQGDNIIVFIIDAMDEEFIDAIVAEDPGFFDGLDGFTRFTNNISLYNTTFPSVANLFTDVPYDHNKPSDVWLDEAYSQGVFLSDIKDQGYVVNLYTIKPYVYSDGKYLEGVADNLDYTTHSVDSLKLVAKLFRFSWLKCAPLAMKWAVWVHPAFLSHMWVDVVNKGPKPYWPDDPQFYKDLADQKIDAVDAAPRFIFYHLDGSHTPYTMDAQAQYVKSGTNAIEQTKGSFFIVYEYIEQMKKLGIYKNATIIITGDHATQFSLQLPERPMLTGLFVKPAGSEGAVLQYSSAPVSIVNMRATSVQAAGGDGTQWGLGYFDVAEDDTTYRYYYHRYQTDGGRQRFIAVYQISGDARDWNNWKLIEMIPIELKYLWGLA